MIIIRKMRKKNNYRDSAIAYEINTNGGSKAINVGVVLGQRHPWLAGAENTKSHDTNCIV